MDCISRSVGYICYRKTNLSVHPTGELAFQVLEAHLTHRSGAAQAGPIPRLTAGPSQEPNHDGTPADRFQHQTKHGG